MFDSSLFPSPLEAITCKIVFSLLTYRCAQNANYYMVCYSFRKLEGGYNSCDVFSITNFCLNIFNELNYGLTIVIILSLFLMACIF